MQYIIPIIAIITSIILFKKAAGTLKPNLMNIISLLFYSILVFEVVGATIIYWGFDKHYLIQKIQNETIINTTYYSLLYTIIIMPICIIIFNKLIMKMFPKEIEKSYINKLKEDIEIEEGSIQNKVYFIIVILSMISIASIIYVFYKIGYIPILKLFNTNFSFNTQRILVSRNFNGNIYIKNIIMLYMTPMLSYIAYAYMKTTQEPKWKKLFIFTLILSILALTYNFEKSPIIYYIFYFLFIDIVLGKTFKLKKIIPYAIGCLALIIILSGIIMGYNGNLISLSTGPMARILVTQVSALFLHFDAFGNHVAFLKGQSFPEILFFPFNLQNYDVRSAEVVMSIYGKTAIENGTAGVMNTLFLGEAYANFGIAGVIIAPILIAILYSIVYCLFLKAKKTPLNIILYIEVINIFNQVLQGGFVDYFYNIKIIVTIIIIFIIKKLAKNKEFMSKLNIKENDESEKKKNIEQDEKRCIFHVPNYIEPNAKSGSTVRPLKMLEAFKANGYKVDVIMGYHKERKEQIKQITKNIQKGIKYEFMYSESSTMPTILTEKNHIPKIPSIDFKFMGYCKENNIKIALYYRDIYWRFDSYGKNLNNIKKQFAIKCYEYDLYKYSKLIDILYLQSKGMAKYLPEKYQKMNIGILPPGTEIKEEILEKKKTHYNNNSHENINIFYVGGIGTLYDITPLLKVVKQNPKLNLTVCCRKEEWEKEKAKYEQYINERIKIVHESGDKLQKYYEKADICSLYFPTETYRNFVMPIKLFEYITNVTPIIATKGTETGKFVTQNNIGWEIEDDIKKLEEIFNKIIKNKNILKERYKNSINVLPKNTWKKRAEQVERDIMARSYHIKENNERKHS